MNATMVKTWMPVLKVPSDSENPTNIITSPKNVAYSPQDCPMFDPLARSRRTCRSCLRSPSRRLSDKRVGKRERIGHVGAIRYTHVGCSPDTRTSGYSVIGGTGPFSRAKSVVGE